MTEFIELDSRYSTTRSVRKADPADVAKELKAASKPEDQFETLVFLPEGQGRQGEGGLRTRGYFKQTQKDKPLITVITVVFNGEAYLEETILSVINQTYDNVEYIIVDGGSTDGTLDIIRKYEGAIDYWVSEEDEGIYEAMNKGIDLATGEWINFMNGGDTFYNTKVLSEVFESNKFDNVEILYGNHQVLYPSGKRRFVKAGKIENLWKGSQFCHQATFVKIHYHKFNKFNLCTRIVADFEFFYRAWKANKNFQYVPIFITSFNAGGVSDVNRIDSILGWWLVTEKQFKVNMNYLIMIMIEELKSGVKKIVS